MLKNPDNDIANRLIDHFDMEPAWSDAGFRNGADTVGVTEPDPDTPVPVNKLTMPAKKARYLELGDGETVYAATFGNETQYYGSELVNPLFQELGQGFEDVFLGRYMDGNVPAARAPLPGNGDWNFIVAPKTKSYIERAGKKEIETPTW